MKPYLIRLQSLIGRHKLLVIILAVGLGLRIALNSAVDSFDFYAFVMWARYLTTHSITNLFEFLPDGYTPYPPFYYYVLLLLGKFISFIGVWNNKWLTYLIIRIPVFTADVAVCMSIYLFVRHFLSKSRAYVAAAFYFLHPAIVYNTSIWGQIDSVVTLLGMSAILLLISKKRLLGIVCYTLGVLTKLQLLALLPLIIFLSVTQGKLKRLMWEITIILLLALIPFLPIMFAKGIPWTWSYFFTIPNWYAYTSVYAYNLWAPFGFIVSDNHRLLGLVAYKYIGILLFWVVAGLILYPLRLTKYRRPEVLMFAAFLLWYDFSFFATRIHSRYLIYSFGFFAPFIFNFPYLGLALSILMVANLLLPLKNPLLAPLTTFLNQPSMRIVGVGYAFWLFIKLYKAYRQLYTLHHEKST